MRFHLPAGFGIDFAYIGSLMNRLLLFFPAVAFIFLCCLLIFNSSRGFDITDESFYLLWAIHPEYVQASASQFGYYTKVLFFFSGENIALFRSLGLLMLLGIAVFFSVSLERYAISLSGQFSNARIKWEIIPFILLCTLAYYRSWQLTPSYNWLALCSTMLVGAGLFNAAAKEEKTKPSGGYDAGLFAEAISVGIGGGVAFMAKPTTALILAVTVLFWVMMHYKKFRGQWILFLIFAATIASSILLIHAHVFKGGIMPFYVHLREGINLGNILGAGHSTVALLSQAIADMESIPTRVFSLSPIGFLFLPVIYIVVQWNIKRDRENLAIHIFSFFLVFFFFSTCYRLWNLSQFYKKGMGFLGVALLFVVVSSAALTRITFNRKGAGFANRSFLSMAGLSSFLFFLAFAYSFGSNNGLVRQMSGGYVFLAAGALYMVFWVDQYINRRFLGNIFCALGAISILLALLHGYNQPYRLPGAISEQDIKITSYNDKFALFVDKPTADYINDLKKAAADAGWTPGNYLIDLTGGTPGATFILDGRFMGVPWLLGSYKGSNDFAKAAIDLIPKSKQRLAWVLTAPKGKREIQSQILTELGLNFPNNYVKLGEAKTGHRNEIQILWKPKNVAFFQCD